MDQKSKANIDELERLLTELARSLEAAARYVSGYRDRVVTKANQGKGAGRRAPANLHADIIAKLVTDTVRLDYEFRAKNGRGLS